MRILAADDESFVLKELVKTIKEVKPEAEVKAFLEPEEVLDYARKNPCDVAFLDIEMGSMSGIEVAKQLKIWYPKINLIFVTGYDEYMAEAFKLHASGYVQKPVTKEAIKAELEELRTPVIPQEKNKLVARCFGTFDVFVNGKSLKFSRSKTKEMLAYLIDRRGSGVTSGELRAVLWKEAETDQNTGIYLQKLKKDLIEVLKEAGVEDVFRTSWNQYAIDPDKISCDYYDYMENKASGIQAYSGEYMAQFSWGEMKRAILKKEL